MVGHVLRFAAEIAELRRVVGSGELGRPLAASAFRLSPPADWNDWMRDPMRSGGTLVDLAIHDFDVLAALLGPARQVHARAVADGTHVSALVEHERGEGTVAASHAMPASYPFTAGLRVLCEGGLVEHRFIAGAGDEVADSDVVSMLAVHPGEWEAARVLRARRRSVAHGDRAFPGLRAGRHRADGGHARAGARGAGGRARRPPLAREWATRARLACA